MATWPKDQPEGEGFNGWIFSVSVGDYRSVNGISYEGIGVAPDVFIKTTKEDLLNGKDVTLEKAIEMLAQ